jgi:hypothetical protein
VYELRTKFGKVNYRILYGFVGKDVALLAEADTKEKSVPSKLIDRAAHRIERYEQETEAHRFIYEE